MECSHLLPCSLNSCSHSATIRRLRFDDKATVFNDGGRFNGRFDGRSGGMFDGMFDGRSDRMFDGMFDGMFG